MDVIVAYSGGAMPCAIGIVRMSGAGSFDIYKRIFVPKKKGAENHAHMVYGEVLARDGAGLDLCYGVCFKLPHSYTGEDMCEFYCHGSPAVVSELIAVCIQNGAHMAEPGDFTKRAFFNGKLDLSRAEAVSDLITSQNLASARNALSQIKGGLFTQINSIYDSIVSLLAHFYAVCDYTDEDIEPWNYEEARAVLEQNMSAISTLVSSFERGNIIKNGIPVTIIGKPNVGKSSLFNAVLGYERAIVSAHAGTTRDTVDGSVAVGGVVLHITDTAGVRRAESEIEQHGIERSRDAAERAHLCLCVIDAESEPSEFDLDAFEMAKNAYSRVLIINKCDLCEPKFQAQIPDIFERVFRVSAKTSEGIGELIEYFATLAQTRTDEVIITNARHAALLNTALGHISFAAQSAGGGVTADAILFDMESALSALGDIMGKNASTDVVGEIFSKFCVGK